VAAVAGLSLGRWDIDRGGPRGKPKRVDQTQASPAAALKTWAAVAAGSREVEAARAGSINAGATAVSLEAPMLRAAAVEPWLGNPGGFDHSTRKRER
jgi:hypothetical protein